MKKQNLLGKMVIIIALQGLTFHGLAYGSWWEKAWDDTGDIFNSALKDSIDWSEGAVKKVAKSGEWVFDKVVDLAPKLLCTVPAVLGASEAVIRKLADKAVAPAFDKISIEGTLGGATFTVLASGSFATKSFDLTLSVGKDGFTADGFKKLFYEPFANLF